jgi:hypothetical protein
MRIIDVDRTKQNGTQILHFYFRSRQQLFDDADQRPLPLTELSEFAEDTLFSYGDEYFVRKPLAFEIGLPENEISSGNGELVAGAVHRHFSQRIPDLEHELKLVRREGLYSLGLMIITAAAAAIFIVRVIAMVSGMPSLTPEDLPPYFSALLFIGFIIIISNWVTFWATIETFIYDYRNLFRKIRIYKKISRVPITVRGYSPEQPPG